MLCRRHLGAEQSINSVHFTVQCKQMQSIYITDTEKRKLMLLRRHFGDLESIRGRARLHAVPRATAHQRSAGRYRRVATLRQSDPLRKKRSAKGSRHS